MLPAREIRKRFTKSDILLMGWRNSEIAFNMQENRKRNRDESPSQRTEPKRKASGSSKYELDATEQEKALFDVPERFLDKNAELDLTKVTGDEAVGYLNRLGLNIGLTLKM